MRAAPDLDVMRLVVGLLLALHGLIHIIGFVVPWRLAKIEGFAYSTTAAWGRIDLGDAGARGLGVAWLLGAVAFLVAGVGFALGTSWAISMVALAAAFSLVLCVAGSPAAIAGLVIDAAILAIIAAALIFR